MTAGDAEVQLQNVLDQMVKGVTERKLAEGANLTRVGTERPTSIASGQPMPSPVPDAPFPYDFPEQTVRQTISQLRREANTINAVAENLERAMNGTREVVPLKSVNGREVNENIVLAVEEGDPGDTVVKLAPVKGVTTVDPADFVAVEQGIFEEQMAAKAAAAQAEVFGAVDDGWKCPTHGAASIIEKTSARTARKYRACTECKEFEK